MFETEDTERCRTHLKISASRWVKPKPPGGESAQEVAAGENQHISIDCAHAREHAIRPCPYVRRRFTTWAAIAKQLPIGTLLEDIDGAATFICAVVPFHQIAINFGH